MSHWLQAIADTEGEITAKESELVQLKAMVNMMCRKAGVAEKFPEIGGVGLVAGVGAAAPAASKILPDQFVGKPLNTAVKEVLMLRRAGGQGPAQAEEIYSALTSGGFEFDGNKDTAISGLRISLGKSSHTFKRLNNGAYGLHEWYGTKPKPKPKSGEAVTPEALEEAFDAMGEETEESST